MQKVTKIAEASPGHENYRRYYVTDRSVVFTLKFWSALIEILCIGDQDQSIVFNAEF